MPLLTHFCPAFCSFLFISQYDVVQVSFQLTFGRYVVAISRSFCFRTCVASVRMFFAGDARGRSFSAVVLFLYPILSIVDSVAVLTLWLPFRLTFGR